MELPVITTLTDYEALNQAVVFSGDVQPSIEWTESTTATKEILRNADHFFVAQDTTIP
jgi:alpha/beta superfamily hydrolase